MQKIITGTGVASRAASAAFVLAPPRAAPLPAIANVADSAPFAANGNVQG